MIENRLGLPEFDDLPKVTKILVTALDNGADYMQQVLSKTGISDSDMHYFLLPSKLQERMLGIDIIQDVENKAMFKFAGDYESIVDIEEIDIQIAFETYVQAKGTSIAEAALMLKYLWMSAIMLFRAGNLGDVTDESRRLQRAFNVLLGLNK